MSKPKIGAHVSTAGKLANGIENARRIGAECIQIFGASPRQWVARGHSKESILEFQRARADAGIGPVYLHAAYLVNLASPDTALRGRSEQNLAAHLQIATDIGADGLIFHIGSGKDMERDKAFAIVVASMKRVLKQVKGTTNLVIENSAGGGQKIGATPEDIGEIMEQVGSDRVRVCWDTAHGFEGGIIDEHTPATVAALTRRLDKAFGVKNLAALHVNDSKTAFNSRHDRHENIGKGYIGLKGFKALAGEKKFYKAAWMLEVPGYDGEGPDKKNVDILKRCFK